MPKKGCMSGGARHDIRTNPKAPLNIIGTPSSPDPMAWAQRPIGVPLSVPRFLPLPPPEYPTRKPVPKTPMIIVPALFIGMSILWVSVMTVLTWEIVAFMIAVPANGGVAMYAWLKFTGRLGYH